MSKFIKGMDLSTLLEMERCGAKYYDHGKERDILDIMRDYDVDTIRLRLWNDPYSETGEPYGAGCNDLAETIAIGKKVSDALHEVKGKEIIQFRMNEPEVQVEYKWDMLAFPVMQALGIRAEEL